MPVELTDEDFDRKIEKAKAEGMAGRKELLETLAKMPMEKVIELPASSPAILGPQGLAQLAAKREELAGAGRRTVARVVKQQPSIAGKSRVTDDARPLRSTAILVTAILAIGLLADLSRPVLVSAILDPGVRSRETSHWPACRRLDHRVDGCVYTTGGGNLSLARVASLTEIPVDQVTGSNRHLTASPDVALPRGSRIVIWRGRLELVGAAQ